MSEVAIITGASSGIGKCLALKLLESGYKIILVARSKDKIYSLRDKIQSLGGKSLALPIDVSKPNEILKLKKHAELFGETTVIINNAGIGKFSKIEDVSLEAWNLHMDINLRASFLISQAFIPKMKKLKKGMLIFINSVAGKMGYPNSTAYTASKFGLTGFANSLREELREDKIKVVSIHPGAVDTPFWNNKGVDFPRNEMLKPEHIAEFIIHAINSPDNLTIEELVIRRVGGDF